MMIVATSPRPTYQRPRRCDACFLGCEPRWRGGEWKFPCKQSLREWSREMRERGYPEDDSDWMEEKDVD